MEAYKCVYSDPHSPLTPLAPMDSNIFTFQVTPKSQVSSSTYLQPKSATKTYKTPQGSTLQPTAVISYKSPTLKVPGTASVKRTVVVNQSHQMIYQKSEHEYQNGRLISSKKTTLVKQVYKADNVIGKYHLSPQCIPHKATGIDTRTPVKKNYVPPRSPVAKKPISPIMEKILIETKLQKYMPLFAREEIDFQVFLSLSEDDLQDLGIELESERKLLVDYINYYREQH